LQKGDRLRYLKAYVAVKVDEKNPVDEIYGKFGKGRRTDDIIAELREAL